MKTKADKAALDVVFFSHDLNKGISIKKYLFTLLVTLWDEGDEFSGKRPFGNSGWEWDVYQPLIKHGFIEGRLDDEGYIDAINEKAAHKYVSELIKLLMED